MISNVPMGDQGIFLPCNLNIKTSRDVPSMGLRFRGIGFGVYQGVPGCTGVRGVAGCTEVRG